MTLIKTSLILLIATSLIFMCIGSAAAQDFGDFDFDTLPEEGDFLEFKFTGSEIGMEMDGHFRMEFTGSETIDVEGESHNCVVMEGYGKGEIDASGITGSWSMSGKFYMDASSGDAVKFTMTMSMSMEFMGEKMEMDMETITIPLSKISNWTSASDPEIGDSWKESESAKVTSKEYENGELNYEDTSTEEVEMYYRYMKDETITTEAGSFNCRVIRSTDDWDYEDPDDYSLNYHSKNLNIPVLMETYEYGDLSFSMELVAYDIAGESAGSAVLGSVSGSKEDKEDAGLLGLGKVAGVDLVILVIVLIIVLVIVLLIGISMSKKKPAPPTRAPYGYPPQAGVSYQAPGSSLQAPATSYQAPGSTIYQAPGPSYQAPGSTTYQAPGPSYQAPGSTTHRALGPSYQAPGTGYQQPPPPPPPAYQRPPPPPPPPPPVPPPQANYCPGCRQTLRYVDQYQKWYCDYCQRYS